MFNIFKKKPPENSQTSDVSGKSDVSGEKQINLDNLAIHAMPERFRHQAAKVKSAKTAGIVIIAGGGALLAAAAFSLYYFLFRSPAPAVPARPENAVSQTESQAQSQPNQAAADLASSTASEIPPATLPAGDELATSTASTTPETSALDDNIGSRPGLDSDSDGLTDAEEALLGASASTPDTDTDSYPDGTEVINLYDPAGKGKLTGNPGIALYENKTFNYGALYPKAWEQSSNGGDDSVMFKSADNQFIQLVVQPNPGGLTLDQWYQDQLEAASINEADRISGANWQGIKNLDGLTVYLTDSKQKYIFSLTYNPGQSNTLEYNNVFQMMVKSFVLNE